MKKKYDEASVIRSLVNKKCVVDARMKVISVPKSVTLGNGSWGKVDYLCHYCGYTQTWLGNKVVSSPVRDDEETLYNKPKRKKDIGVMSVNIKRITL